MNKRLALFVSLLVTILLGLTGCTPGELAELEIVPGYYKLEPGQSVELTLLGSDKYGNSVYDFADPCWNVEDNIGTLSTTTGLKTVFTAEQIGQGNVVATVDGLTAKITVEVLDNVPNPLKLEDSFEDEVVGNFPQQWIVKNLDHHESNGTGPRVATDVPNIPDGSKALKYTNIPRSDGVPVSEAFIELPEISRGRLEFSAYQPEKNSSNFGIKPFRNEDRLIDFWLSAGGDLRLPDKEGEKIGLGQWQTYAIEWDVNAKRIKVFHLKDNKWIEKSPANGYALTGTPNRLSIDGGTVEGNNTWGAIDNIKLFDLDLVW